MQHQKSSWDKQVEQIITMTCGELQANNYPLPHVNKGLCLAEVVSKKWGQVFIHFSCVCVCVWNNVICVNAE